LLTWWRCRSTCPVASSRASLSRACRNPLLVRLLYGNLIYVGLIKHGGPTAHSAVSIVALFYSGHECGVFESEYFGCLGGSVILVHGRFSPVYFRELVL